MAETKQRIFDAASQLFFDKGYEQTTVSEIIEAAKTNKGSFYHHFEDKKHLAYDISLTVSNEIEAGIKALYQEIDTISRLFLTECTFWKVFFQQDNIRRFISEVYAASYVWLKLDIYDAILNMAPKSLSSRELLMIQGLEIALKSKMTSFVGNIAEKLEEEEFVRFYLRVWLGTYGIPEKVIDMHTDKAYEQISELEIKSERFKISIKRI
jgi:AcrR family transcriptional regulator